MDRWRSPRTRRAVVVVRFKTERLIMKKQNLLRYLPFVVVALLSALLPSGGFCAPDSSPIRNEAAIEGQDHDTLKAFFGRFEQDRASKLPTEEVSQVLYRALPESYKKACQERVNRLGDGADGTAGMAVKVVYVEERKEERPIRALVTFACSSKAESYAGRVHDERLASLVIDRASSRLSLMKREAEQDKRPESVRITVEKEVHIGGHMVVGLNFARSEEGASGGEATGILREETINFYVFEDNDIRPAGSLLKEREERLPDSDGEEVKSVYSASVVFKKDMKGNIIGILSPFTMAANDKRVGKGMVRYSWDGEKHAFVKE
jgi:hypothetical protein